MPSTRPRVAFNSTGICNACGYKKKSNKTNFKQREATLKKTIKNL